MNLDFTTAQVPLAVPTKECLEHAEASLVKILPDTGLGLQDIKTHLLADLAPGFNQSSRCATYWAFTTGGVTEAAMLGDWLATIYDQNAQVHLPEETIATKLEDTTLRLLQQLLTLNETDFSGRLFTTGATASNLVGLALGREYVVAEAGRRKSPPADVSVTQLGVVAACIQAGINDIQVLAASPHSSLYKAASTLGIGRDSLILIPLSEDEPWRFDLPSLREYLSNGTGSIIAVSAGEVWTGRFATNGDEMGQIRALADEYGAWVHVDGAFGLQALILPQAPSYRHLTDGVAALQLADSISGDAHKLLNVPYDCGFFFTRHPSVQQTVFKNPSSAYLSTTALAIPSPLNLGIENSRRLRALPLYSSLLANGRKWHCDLLERQVALARQIASYIVESTVYELLPDSDVAKVYMVVLFRARSDSLNTNLVSLINASKRVHVSGLTWRGRPAARIAVGTWRVEVDRDFRLVVQILEAAVEHQ